MMNFDIVYARSGRSEIFGLKTRKVIVDIFGIDIMVFTNGLASIEISRILSVAEGAFYSADVVFFSLIGKVAHTTFRRGLAKLKNLIIFTWKILVSEANYFRVNCTLLLKLVDETGTFTAQ